MGTCAQMCFKANANFGDYSALSAAKDSTYCEAFEYDANSGRRQFHSLIMPTERAGANCFVSKELADPCVLPAGAWLRDSDHKVYYVSESGGGLRSVDNELTCFGELVWGGQGEPKDLWCDGTVNAACDQCINKPLSHNKFLGKMTCNDLQVKVERVCQFETAEIECRKGQVIRVLEGSYGRFSRAYCGSPSVDSVSIDGTCGEIDNAHDQLENLCDGKNMCTIDATDDAFSDQGCAATYKYVQARYSCIIPDDSDHAATSRHAADNVGA